LSQDEKDLKLEFEEWFDNWLIAGHKSAVASCFWRDVIRGCKADLFKEFLRLNGYIKPVLNPISGVLL